MMIDYYFILFIADDLSMFAMRYIVQAGAPLPPQTIQITTFADSLPEDAEGAILVLSFEESELDERDVGQVQLVRDSYLVRINESVGIQEPEGKEKRDSVEPLNIRGQ